MDRSTTDNWQIVLLCLILGILGCEGATESTERKKITVGYLPIIAHLPAATAEKNGAFKDLDITYRVFGSSNDLLSSLSRGDIDVATTVAVAPVAAKASKRAQDNARSPVLIFSYSETKNDHPFDGVFVRSDSPIEGLKDLSSQRVGLFPGSTAKNILAYLLRSRYGLDSKKVQWVFLPPSVQLESLRSGDIDVLYTYETVRTTAELSKGIRNIHGSVVASVLDGAPYGCSAINRAFSERHPDIARRFIDALDSGIEAVRKSPDEARRVLEQKLGVNKRVAQECNIERRLTSNEIGKVENLKRFDEFLQLLAEAGEVRHPVSSKDLIWTRD